MKKYTIGRAQRLLDSSWSTPTCERVHTVRAAGRPTIEIVVWYRKCVKNALKKVRRVGTRFQRVFGISGAFERSARLGLEHRAQGYQSRRIGRWAVERPGHGAGRLEGHLDSGGVVYPASVAQVAQVVLTCGGSCNIM